MTHLRSGSFSIAGLVLEILAEPCRLGHLPRPTRYGPGEQDVNPGWGRLLYRLAG